VKRLRALTDSEATVPRKKPPLQLVKTSPARRPPVEHRWTEADFEVYRQRFWRLPKEAVETGLLARIWDDGSSRGFPTASSILPTLAFHAWLKEVGDEWTPFVSLSVRRIAALAGVDKNSVTKVGLKRLEELALLETRLSHAHTRDGGNARLEYRLHRSLFPRGERAHYAQVTGNLICGGHLAMLPKASARHMLLAIMALDPVLNQNLLAGWMAGEGREEPVADTLARRRESECEATISRLVDVTGMATSTAQQALDVLTRRLDDKEPLVLRTGGRWGRVYFFNAHRLDWHWTFSFLNDRPRRRETANRIWGSVIGRAA
jgi:hypothetical protein